MSSVWTKIPSGDWILIGLLRGLANKCKGKITLENFLNYFEIKEFVTEKDQPEILVEEARDENSSRFKTRVQDILSHPLYDGVISAIVGANMFLIVIKDIIERFDGSKAVIYSWIYLQLLISIMYVFEIVLTLYAFGLKNTIQLRIYLIFESLFQGFIYGFWINLLVKGTGAAESLLRTLEIVIILRSFRMIKILEEIHQFKIIIKTIKLFISSFYSLILVTFVVFLFFSIIGDRLFGGI